MKFEEILPALREGKKIKRKEWQKNYYIVFGFVDMSYQLTLTDIIKDDWEIVREKKKVKVRDLTKEQFKKYCKSITQAPNYGKGCIKCPFHNVSCTDWYEECWINHKDLYSDKFLDQEIEIEE